MGDQLDIRGDVMFFGGVKAATITSGNLWPTLRSKFEMYQRGRVIGDVIEFDGVPAALINGDLSPSARAEFVEIFEENEAAWKRHPLRPDPPLKGDLFQNPNPKRDAA